MVPSKTESVQVARGFCLGSETDKMTGRRRNVIQFLLVRYLEFENQECRSEKAMSVMDEANESLFLVCLIRISYRLLDLFDAPWNYCVFSPNPPNMNLHR